MSNSLQPHDLRSAVNAGPPLTHTLGPIAARTVDALRQQPDVARRHIHAVIAAQGEARAALHAYDVGWIGAPGLEARLRDILAICEAAGGTFAQPEPAPAGVELQSVGSRHAGVVAVQQPGRGAN